MRRGKNSPTIYLADLKRHVFSSEYQPYIAASGEHILDFDVLAGVSFAAFASQLDRLTASDATAFEKTIKDFGKEYGHGP